MYPPSLLENVTGLAEGFLAGLSPDGVRRVEAKASGPGGMQLLCAVEAALASALPSRPARELVWLGGAATAGAHRLHIQAFGVEGALLAETVHEFAG